MTLAAPGVLHVIANLERGGAQEVVRTVAPALSAAGYRPIVATMHDGPLRVELESAGVPVELIPGRRHALSAPHYAIPEIDRIRRDLVWLIRKHRIAIVQTHLLRSLDFLLLVVARQGGARGVVWTIHNARLDLRPDQLPPGRIQRALLNPKRLGYRALYRVGARAGARFVAVAEEVAVSIAQELRPPPGSVTTIPNAVDVDRYPAHVVRASVREALAIAPSETFLLAVGKLEHQKGHDLLIDALARIGPLPGVVVCIAGEGERQRALAAQLEATGLAGSVRLLGRRSDVPALLAAADAFVLPSRWEGLPMALLEAMASGLPALATRVSGSSEVIEDGVSGLLVDPGNVEALGGGLDVLLAVARDPVRRAAMAAAARRRVEASYGVRAQAAAYAALYGRLLGSGRPARPTLREGRQL